MTNKRQRSIPSKEFQLVENIVKKLKLNDYLQKNNHEFENIYRNKELINYELFLKNIKKTTK
jgi:hypothetical protein